jgi:hypothetical protein
MKQIWLRLGRTDAINWIVIAVVATLQFVGSFVITNANPSGRELLFVGCIAVSVIVVILILLLTRYGLIPFTHLKARPFVLLAMLQVAAVARAVAYDYLLVTLNFAPEGMLFSRVYASQFNIFVAGIVVASLVAMARDFSESNEKLSHTLGKLQAAQEDVESRLKNRRTALLASIRSQLESALSSVSGLNVSSDTQHLKSMIDDVVRPISHRLGREFSATTDEQVLGLGSRIRWSSVTKYALETNPVHPVWLTLWTAFVSFQVISIAAGEEFALPYISAVVMFGLWFTASRFVWKKTANKLGVLARALSFSVLMMSTPLVVNYLLELEFGLQFFNGRVVISAALYFLVMAWSLALVIAVAGLLKRTNLELVEATTQLRRRLVTDNVSALHFEQAVSHVLHGPIQDAIAASLKRIQSMPPDALPGDSEVEIVRNHIENALQLLNDSPLRNYSIERGLKGLAALWSGLVDINVSLDKKTVEVLESAQTTSSIIIEVVREAVSNAIRHGDATKIDIDIKYIEFPADIHITVNNNGKSLSTQTSTGIGTKLLTDMTLEWSRENHPEGVELRAIVPLEKRKSDSLEK